MIGNTNASPQIKIVDYLLAIGEPIVPADRSGKYFMHREHNSLKINSSRNYFFWNSRETGGDLAKYLMVMFNLTYPQAMSKIETDCRNLEIVPAVIPKKVYPKTFTYRVKENPISLESKKYLVVERKLPNTLVQHLIDTSYIAEDQDNQIIFKWYRDNKIVGLSKQGTKKRSEEEIAIYKREYVKYIAPTTEKDTFWGFNYLIGKPVNLFIFESEIDLLSYLALFKDDLQNSWLICIHGLKVETVYSFLRAAAETLTKELAAIESLSICFDNDNAGIKTFNLLTKELTEESLTTREFLKEMDQFLINGNSIINRIPSIPHEFPTLQTWDWNEQLKYEKGKGRA